VLDFCLRVGEILLSSGAGAADVSVTMQAVAAHFGLRHPEVDVTFTSLAMSHQADSDDHPVVAIRTVKLREIDYEDLTQVDRLVRCVLVGECELAEARQRLSRIVSSGHQRARWAVTAAWGLMCAGVAVQLGGTTRVALVAVFAAISIDLLQHRLTRRRLPYFYRQLAGGAVASVLAAVANAAGVPGDVSLIVSANIVMLLAGVGFMGAIQDALSGFYLTASARILEAILATAGIIAGASAGLSLAASLGVDIGHYVPGQVGGWDTIPVTAAGAAVAAAAFAYASYAPRRILLPIAVIAGLAMAIQQAIEGQGFERPWASGIAAFFVGLVSYAVSGKAGIPPLVTVVSAVVPMLPGLLIYRGLSLLALGGQASSPGLVALVTAASVAIALAAGVLLGEYVAQPLRREARRLERRLAGPRLVGPLIIRPRRTRPAD
jgi:uncharacterized membrane protein YjjP (DUF1212 family)